MHHLNTGQPLPTFVPPRPFQRGYRGRPTLVQNPETLAQIALVGAVALLLFDRSGAVGHSAFVGGAIAGWVYAHLLGFGRTSFLQRILHQRHLEASRFQSMSADQFVAEEIDPLLEKISQRGLASLSRSERRLLEQAREKMLSENAP